MPTENYSPNWHVRCVSVPGPDTDLTLHVSFDNARYIFGCGEGTQRAYVQKKLSLKGVEAVFLSDAQNKTRMGLPGLIMTAADGGMSQLNVVGPPDTSHFISTFRSSVMRADFKVIPKSMPIGKTPHDVTEMFQSSNVTVKAVSLVPAALRTTSISTDNPPINIHDFRPDFSVTRPSTMSRPELEAWRDLIVSHMFVRDETRGGHPKGPFVRPDGVFAASWPEIKYPLPLPTAEEQATELVYILEPPPIRGKFDVKRAAALGVPNGPIRGKLVKGEDIEVDDPSVEGGKRIVRPADCLVGGGPGMVLIIVSCSPINLPSLLESSAFARYQTSATGTEEGRKVHMMVHRVSSRVWRDPAYQAWMSLFGEETQHFLADPETYSNDLYFRSAGHKMLDLGLIDETIFRRPHYGTGTPFEAQQLPLQSSVLVPNHQVRMHPPSALETIPYHDKDIPLSLEIHDPLALLRMQRAERLAETPKGFEDSRNAHYRVVQIREGRAKQGPQPQPGEFIEITTLGTGSAIPSKYRNVSATMLRIPSLCQDGDDGAILLDCGEGTLGQMRRRWGPDGMRKLYGELKMIFISHMHADHHLGLHSILEDRFRHGIQSPLYVLGPPSIGLHLQESSSWQTPASDEALANLIFLNSTRISNRKVNNQNGRDRLENHSPVGSPKKPISEENQAFLDTLDAPPFLWGQEDMFNGSRRWPNIDCLGTSDANNRVYFQGINKMLTALDLEWMQVPKVAHRGAANGLVLVHNSGWKIVYSGDTKPCETLVIAGKGATLLIHEATLEDDKADMAFFKGHSTFSQAIQVGRDMQASHILLNHFSQRYPKVPKLPALMPTSSPSSPTSGEKNDKTEPVVSISFDLMSIKIGEMWKMAHYMEPISLLFPEEEEADVDDVESVAAEKKGKKEAVQGQAVKGQKGAMGGAVFEGHGRTNKKRKSPIPSTPRSISPGGKRPAFGLLPGRSSQDARDAITTPVKQAASGSRVGPIHSGRGGFAGSLPIGGVSRRDFKQREFSRSPSRERQAAVRRGYKGIDGLTESEHIATSGVDHPGPAAAETGLTPALGHVEMSGSAPEPRASRFEKVVALLQDVETRERKRQEEKTDNVENGDNDDGSGMKGA